MSDVKKRCFRLEGDLVEVEFSFDRKSGCYFGNYPDFELQPRLTESGKPWVNATYSDCPHVSGEFDDCGSCRFFIRENKGDLIGICANPTVAKTRKE